MTPQTEQTNAPLVEFRRVSYAVNGGRPIIDALNLEVQLGETLVLLGESGCGKTTTLRLVNRLLTPTSGQVLVEGKATTAWDVIQLRRRTGYVIQEAGLFPHFTVACMNCSISLASIRNGSRNVIRASCPAVSVSASAWRERWRPIRRCF